jgi:TatD DNase family protein
MKPKPRLFDIAANLADESYVKDLPNVFQRAKDYNVDRLLFGGTYLEDSQKSYDLSLANDKYYCTVGLHPCRATEPTLQKNSTEEYFAKLEEIIKKAKPGKIVAIGECGLDYDRFMYASKETQLK